jgi:hypothetical protein
LTANQFTALSAEDQFATAFNEFAQYGVIYGSLAIDQDVGSEVP